MLTKIDTHIKYGKQHGGFGIEILYPGLIRPQLKDSGFSTLGRIDHASITPGTLIPMHPHRDDEIFTYLRSGKIKHRDSEGYTAVLSNRNLMMMNAGAQFYHEEKVLEEGGVLEGLQIFIRPAIAELKAQVKFYELEDVYSINQWRKLAGKGSDYPLEIRSETWVMDMRLGKGEAVLLPEIEVARPAILFYVFNGKVEVNGAMLLSKGESVLIEGEIPQFKAIETADIILLITQTNAIHFDNGMYSGNLHQTNTNKMKKNITVLGASGTVGSKVAAILLQEGHHVTVLARHTDKLERFRHMGAEIISADVNDVEVITHAFKKSDSAFLILPDNVKAENTRLYQRQVTGNLIKAIESSGIRYIVNMSSLGSHMHEGNGMMAGTGEQEVRLNQLEDVNVLHIRSAYFMDNFLRTIGLVKNKGINGTVADGDHAIPMVATQDVAKVIAARLANTDFKGKNAEPVMGPKEYTYREFTSIIGQAIGNPELPYVQLPVEQAKGVFLGNGFSEDFVNNLLEMGTAVKTGFMNYEKRERSTITVTTAEEFVKDVYVPVFNQ